MTPYFAHYLRRWHSPCVGFACSFTRGEKTRRYSAHFALNLAWISFYLTLAPTSTAETASRLIAESRHQTGIQRGMTDELRSIRKDMQAHPPRDEARPGFDSPP